MLKTCTPCTIDYGYACRKKAVSTTKCRVTTIWSNTFVNTSTLRNSPKAPPFRTLKGRSGKLNDNRLHRTECLAMIKRRCKQAGMENASMLCNHTFRGTGITAYLRNDDAKLEHAQLLAGHANPKTTLLYDRRSDEISLDEVEKIGI